ncbi:MAG: hypothetical protein KC486_26655 [Myxococcales bacterium]|nr:hypothetical protein [Myxococcales bacterium]
MSRRRSVGLRLAERVALRLIDGMSKAFLGFVPPVNEEAVRTLGVRGYFRWSTSTGKVMKTLADGLGEAESQLVIGFAGLWLGCGYCGAGHIHAGNLILFRDEGVLTPLSDEVIDELYETPDERAEGRLRELLSEPRYARILALVLRVYQLRAGAEPSGADDDYIALALTCWDWVTECTIVEGLEMRPATVPPLTPLAKNMALRERYAAARAAEAVERDPGEGDAG